MNMYKYLYGYEYERMCGRCVSIYGLYTFAIDYKDAGCIPCLVEKILTQRKILRSYDVT